MTQDPNFYPQGLVFSFISSHVDASSFCASPHPIRRKETQKLTQLAFYFPNGGNFSRSQYDMAPRLNNHAPRKALRHDLIADQFCQLVPVTRR